MHIDPIKLGLPFALLGFPLTYALIEYEDQTPWMVGMAAYFLAGILTMARYQPIAYRVTSIQIWGQFAINLLIAGLVVLGWQIVRALTQA